MEQRKRIPLLSKPLLLGAGSLCAAACGQSDSHVGQSTAALVAECSTSQDALPADAWVCPDARTIECTSGTGTVDPGTLYVRDSDTLACKDKGLSVSNEGPFAPGSYDISVSDDEDKALCTAKLTVTDTAAPKVESHTIFLWPPNHKVHAVSVDDCVTVTDACQGEMHGEFIWASSDEPVDDLGDGHHQPDIAIDDCGNVSVRAERQGPKDGRVYKLGVRVVDAAGNATEGECQVIVDHDQRGVDGADSGESYRITFDGTNGTPTCDGVTDAPPTDGIPSGGSGDGDGSDGNDGSDPSTPSEPTTPVDLI